MAGIEIIDLALTVASITTSLVNAILLAALVRIYYCTYREIRVKISKGLLIFSSFMLFQQIVLGLSLVYINTIRWPDDGGPLFIINLIELFAVVVLYRIARE